MPLLTALLLVVASPPELFAQYEKLNDGGSELRVYELPSQRVMTRLKVYQGEEAPFVISPDGQIAVSDYTAVHHWSRKTGWRQVDHFGLRRIDGRWMYGENTAEKSGQFSPDGKHFLFRVYGTMGAGDMDLGEVAVFRTSDLRRWVSAHSAETARWVSATEILAKEVWFEVKGEEMERKSQVRRFRLPTSNSKWIAPPRDTRR